jgi:hypothetical protein
MTDSRNDCERISRRVVVTGTALALGAAAAATVAERVQGRRRRNQPERLVPAVRQEDLELLDR